MTSILRGVLWMSGAVLSFCAMAIAARELLKSLGIFEILFFRTGVALLIVLAVAARIGIATLRTRRIGVHLWRNLFHLGGQASWVFALGALPLATVFAIEFTAPIWTAVLATLMLGERMNRGRVVMLALGFAGVLVILRPPLLFGGAAAFDPAALVVLAAALFFSVQIITTKFLTGTQSTLTILFWMNVMQLPAYLATNVVLGGDLWFVPRIPASAWLPLLALLVTGLSAHVCFTNAMRYGDATLVVPIDFLRIPFIAGIGVLLYAEPFDPLVLLGAAISAAGIVWSLVEARHYAARRNNGGASR